MALSLLLRFHVQTVEDRPPRLAVVVRLLGVLAHFAASTLDHVQRLRGFTPAGDCRTMAPSTRPPLIGGDVTVEFKAGKDL